MHLKIIKLWHQFHFSIKRNNDISLSYVDKEGELFQQLKQSVETESKKEKNDRTRNSTYSHKNREGADIPGMALLS